MALLGDTNDLYNKMSPNGQRYMLDLFKYSHLNPQATQHVLKLRDLYAQQNSGSVRSLQNSLYNASFDEQVINNSIQESSRIASINDRKQINAFFERPDVTQNMNAGHLFKKFDTQHKTQLQALAEGKFNQALRDEQKQNGETVTANAQPVNADNKAQKKVQKAASHDYAKEGRVVRHGADIYQGLTPQGQRLFMTNLDQARHNPKHFLSAKNADVGSMSKGAYRDWRYRDSIAQGSRYQGPVPTSDQKAINGYFRRSDVVPTIQDGILSNIITGINHKNQAKRFAKAQQIKQASQPKQVHDYQSTNPELFRTRIAQGLRLYDSLSPQGRKYMLTAARVANYDLNDFNQAQHGDPKHLTPNQSRIRHRLQQASGIRQSQNDSHMILTSKAMPKQERTNVDKYFDDPVTQDSLSNGSLYHYLLQQNIRARNLEETREDEANSQDKHATSFDKLLSHAGQMGPLGYALGTAIGGVPEDINHGINKYQYYKRIHTLKKQQKQGLGQVDNSKPQRTLKELKRASKNTLSGMRQTVLSRIHKHQKHQASHNTSHQHTQNPSRS